MLNTDKIASVIRARREALGYSQEYMGEMLDICQSSFANLESGKTTITIDRLIRIAEILDLQINRLLDPDYEETADASVDSTPYTLNITPETKEVYDQLIHELKTEIEFLRNLVKAK